MPRRKNSRALTGVERMQLRKLVDDHRSDAEVLRALFGMLPSVMHTPDRLARVLASEVGVPEEDARTWLYELGEPRCEELAECCWTWMHRNLRGLAPVRRVARLEESQLEMLKRERERVAELVATPAGRSRQRFEVALAETYEMAGLKPPRVLWVEGVGAGFLMHALCFQTGHRREQLASLLMERRFMQPAQNVVERMLDSLAVSLRDFMPEEFEGELVKYLAPGLLGADVRHRVMDPLWAKLGRLDPVVSTRLSLGLKERFSTELWSPVAGLWDSLREFVTGAANQTIAGERPSIGRFRLHDRGVFWLAYLERASVAHLAAKVGTDPVPELARAHSVMYELATQGYWSWLGEKVAICADGPTAVEFDDDGRVHNEHGPAVAFADGFEAFAIEGYAVPEFVVREPERVTVKMIERERNAEMRRILINVFGRGRYLTETGATVIDMDMVDIVPGDPAYGSMPRALLIDREQRKWLVGTDGSTRRVYYMQVPQRVENCTQAHNALAGFDETHIVASS